MIDYILQNAVEEFLREIHVRDCGVDVPESYFLRGREPSKTVVWVGIVDALEGRDTCEPRAVPRKVSYVLMTHNYTNTLTSVVNIVATT